MPGQSDEAPSQQTAHWLPFTAPRHHKRGRSWESADRLGNDSVAGERGTSGSWCVEAELSGRKTKSRLESLLKSGHNTALENLQRYGKGTAVRSLLPRRHAFLTAAVAPFLVFSRVLQLWFRVAPDLSQPPLQQFPLQRAQGKVQPSCESGETAWGSDTQNVTAKAETAPWGEWRGARKKKAET